MNHDETQLERNPVFKGCTRPPMLAGGPMMPMGLTWLIGAILMLNSLVYSDAIGIGFPLPLTIGILTVLAIVYIRVESKVDEHRLNQQILKMREGFKHKGPTRIYFPIQYEKRK